eukprot:757991-Hanusia_phi.AAC.2
MAKVRLRWRHVRVVTRREQGVREGTFTSAELVEHSIQQISKVNRSINAAVAERFAQARLEAARADEVGPFPPPLCSASDPPLLVAFASPLPMILLQRVSEARGNGTLESLPPLLGVPFSVKVRKGGRGESSAVGAGELRCARDAKHVRSDREDGEDRTR